MGWTFALAAVAVFVLTVAAERILIPILRSHKMGQVILDIGPRWHKNKEGTPIMGGLGFILATLVVMAVFFIVKAVRGEAEEYVALALTLGFGAANGAIGFFDDYRKLVKKENEGLTWKQKLVLQLAISAAYVVTMSYTGNITTEIRMPFCTNGIDFGWGFYPIATIVLTGIINGGNITDGVDGLASSVTFVAGGFYAVLAFASESVQLSMIGAVLLGSSLGFLIYNFHPAKVFMGDTGSLFFGALVVGGAFMEGQLWMGITVGTVFILEMFSSLLQVLYFRLSGGKRLFLMAPYHHHLEKKHWSENKIVFVFSLAELLFCVLAFFI